jgi:hypothetical protein
MVLLRKIFQKEGQTYAYIYDFGDDLIHKIILEKITNEKMLMASCIGCRKRYLTVGKMRSRG